MSGYAGVSTNDRQIIPLHVRACGNPPRGGAGRAPCKVKEVGSGAIRQVGIRKRSTIPNQEFALYTVGLV
jgi:hypothetical protein